MVIHALTVLGAELLSLVALAIVGLSVIYAIERIRRWRADRNGFAEFLAAGAPLAHPQLTGAFDVPDSLVLDQQRTAVVSMGDLAVPSGRIIVEDPSLAGMDGESPAKFDTTFPIGRFPVEALVLTHNGDQRIAAVRIRFSADATDTLEPAFTDEWRTVQARLRRELPWISG